MFEKSISEAKINVKVNMQICYYSLTIYIITQIISR